MDIATLRIYLGLCRNLHFGRTSEEFHLSASALSRLVQRLEESVGHPLFLRDNRTVQLTEQGKRFREFARETLDQWEQMQRDLAEAGSRLQGQLSLFASVTASQMILPHVLARFRREFPDIHIQLDTGYAVNALQRLSEGTDVVVAAMSTEAEENLEKKIITSTPILAVRAAGEGTGADLDWTREPLVLPSHGQVRDNIDRWLKEQGIQPNIYTEVAGNEATLSLVALGCGVGFVPQLVLESSPLAERLEVLPAAGPRLENFHVGFCTRKRSLERSAIIRAFWSAIDVHP